MIINQKVNKAIKDCEEELDNIGETLQEPGIAFNPLTMYLTNYSIIKVCGTIERSYKTLIVDFFDYKQSHYIKNYLDDRILESSANPTLQNMHMFLNQFDESLTTKFREELDNQSDSLDLKTSMGAMNADRNAIAHGKNTTTTFSNARTYLRHSIKVIEILDRVLNEEDIPYSVNDFFQKWD